MSVTSTLPTMNRRFRLAARPSGMPKESDFALSESPIDPPGDGEVLAKAIYISIDPYVRNKMGGVTSYTDPIDIGDTVAGLGIGCVVESRNPRFVTGDVVLGEWGWQEFAVSNGGAWLKLNAQTASVSARLGVLGMSGITAYFGVVDLCQAKSGDTLVVSGAAGSVGSLVGQIAKILGCRAIGIAGSDEKVACLVNELGFDGAFNYKSTSDYTAALMQLCPNGIDCYFDNVGGVITDAVLPSMNVFGRVALCGLMSEYNQIAPEPGPRMLREILVKQLRVEGFLFTRFQNRWGEGLAQIARWLGEGKLKYREEIVDGFTNLPQAFIGLLQGRNIGKMLVRL
jgi:NADPH-dependent curcumin reductase CurA